MHLLLILVTIRLLIVTSPSLGEIIMRFIKDNRIYICTSLLSFVLVFFAGRVKFYLKKIHENKSI